MAHEERTEEQTFPAAGLTTLDVDGSSGSINITGADTDSVHVVAEISDGLRKTGHSREVVGNTLQLHSTCPNFGSDWCRVDYEVTVPRDMTLTVRSGDGSVDISGMSSPVDIDTDNGSVDLADLSGDVRVSSDNGRIDAVRLRSQTVTADTDNGRLTLEFAEPPTTVAATADNGRITIVVPNDATAYRVETATDNGSRNVTVADRRRQHPHDHRPHRQRQHHDPPGVLTRSIRVFRCIRVFRASGPRRKHSDAWRSTRPTPRCWPS